MSSFEGYIALLILVCKPQARSKQLNNKGEI